MLLYVALFLFWVFLNGKFNPEICIFGLVLSGALTWFSRRYLGYGEKKGRSLKFYALFLEYLVVLFVEIIKANISVLRFVCSSEVEVDPLLVTFTPELTTDFSRVVLANSITLTPGTITVDQKDGVFTVHCLDKSLAEDIEDSVFVKMLKTMEEA